jgi:hypothetical protein
VYLDRPQHELMICRRDRGDRRRAAVEMAGAAGGEDPALPVPGSYRSRQRLDLAGSKP